MGNPNQLPLYLKLYQLTKYLYIIQKNFPKEYKYTLGETILRLSWICVDEFLFAYDAEEREKYCAIIRLSRTFDRLKIRLRLCYEVGLIRENQHTHLCSAYFYDIGAMIGGWKNKYSRFSL